MNVNTTQLYALVSNTVSAIDGITNKTMEVKLSAWLGTLAETIMKLNNRIMSPTVQMHGSDTYGISVIVSIVTSAVPGGFGNSAGTLVLFHGVPYFLVGSAAISGALIGSLASTGTTQIRKILVGFIMPSAPASNMGFVLSYASGTAASNVRLGFVYGSAYKTQSAGSVSVGTDSAFDAVPLPKASANMIAVGWLNIVACNTSTVLALSAASFRMDLRQTQGANLAVFLSAIVQP